MTTLISKLVFILFIIVVHYWMSLAQRPMQEIKVLGKRVRRTDPDQKFIGMVGEVLSDFSRSSPKRLKGRVRIAGENWSAEAIGIEEAELKEGTRVRIVSANGLILSVKPLEGKRPQAKHMKGIGEEAKSSSSGMAGVVEVKATGRIATEKAAKFPLNPAPWMNERKGNLTDTLKLCDTALYFKYWEIPYADIEKAVLFRQKESCMDLPWQVVSLKAHGREYHFQISNTFDFPCYVPFRLETLHIRATRLPAIIYPFLFIFFVLFVAYVSLKFFR